MEKSKERLEILLLGYFNQSITKEDNEELWSYVLDPVYQIELEQLFPNAYDSEILIPNDELDLLRKQNILNYIFNHQQSQSGITVKKLWPRRIAVAAAILLVISVGLIFFRYKLTNQSSMEGYNVVTPGKVGATLTLANGKKIKLSEAVNGKLAQEAGVVITKSANGQLIYELKEADHNLDKMNTLSTANGENYQVHLPDGSLVYLNATSSLTYSVGLIDHGKRRVRLDGEAYFEISKDKMHPFIVESKGQEVKVLGTHFNVNSYADEEVIKTTLLEGSVHIGTADEQKTLKPGEQAIVRANKIKLAKVDLEAAVAWKNGEFVFNGESITEIMRILSRWYNVEIEYQGPITRERFEGSILKEKNITEVLELLKLTNAVHFKIEGRKIIVTK
ncbi:FecR family protein [Pedobacter sp.]|jgi:transmembrane sensor|uniref:FecR family protein n=1 Tax=Pedobacter sp. TaxID=1411316 RepID=UPI002BBEDF1F|nr:FecR domain-containing protein [Pedobacter sp.]HWW43240.1 FecR domain-containing protein [Pedobacter sp.]